MTLDTRPNRQARRSETRWKWLLVALAVFGALVALGLDRLGGRGGGPSLEAVPDLLRAGAATVVLFAACGYAPARLLCPPALRPWLPLIVLPVGAATSGLALLLLGVLHVPLWASLVVVIGLGVAAGVAVRRRAPAEPRRDRRDLRLQLLAPAAVAIAVAALLASPMVRNDSFATVLGQNGDAHMSTGAAELLQHAPPGAERPELPLDHMPPVWRSKYPIYYVLAGASTLSGLDPVQTFGTVLAIVLALAVVGFYLFAVGVLGAGPLPALAGMTLVALDRFVFRLGFEPFFNHAWAFFTFPFVLVMGWLYLRRPSRGSLVLLVLFGALSVLAYPLLAPFPLLFLAVAAWQAWRRARKEGRGPGWIAELRLPRGRRSLVLWIPLAAVLVPAGWQFLSAAFDKMRAAAEAALPGGDLAPWSGATPGFQPIGFFFGVPDTLAILPVLVGVLAVIGFWRSDRDARIPLAVVLGALLFSAIWFDLRNGGALFHYRALSFFGPLVLVLAGVGLAYLLRQRPLPARVAGLAAAAVLGAFMVSQVRQALDTAFPHVTKRVWQLRTWNDRLPRGASVRLDVQPIGVQQWAGYMLSDHPLSASKPLLFFFPHAPVGRKADYLLVDRRQPRPRDAGRRVEQNSEFTLYRMRPGVPGPDVSSRTLVDPQLAPGNQGAD